MSVGISAKITGDREVMAKIKILAEKNINELKNVIIKSVFVVEGRAKKEVPVLTGRLRSSITNEVKKEGKGYTGQVGTNVIYAPFVEFGTSRRSAKPYLFPAMKNSKADIIKFLERAIKGIRV